MKSKTTRSPAVQATNSLTARCCSHMGAEEFVLSGAGLWPLPAPVAAVAGDPAGAELAAALDRPTDNAQQEALAIIDILRGGKSITAALGIRTLDNVPLDLGWSAPLPSEVVGALTDQAALDL